MSETYKGFMHIELTVKPKPLTEIKVKKVQFGKKASDRPTVNLYDPCAPQDRTLDTYCTVILKNML